MREILLVLQDLQVVFGNKYTYCQHIFLLRNYPKHCKLYQHLQKSYQKYLFKFELL